MSIGRFVLAGLAAIGSFTVLASVLVASNDTIYYAALVCLFITGGLIGIALNAIYRRVV